MSVYSPSRRRFGLGLGLGLADVAASGLLLARGDAHAQPAYDLRYEIVSPVSARHGMVVCEQAIASQIGVQVLRDGGNAVDAAVAVGFALAVVLPYAGNLGGGGFMLVHMAETGKSLAFDFRETAPAAASRDMFVDAAGKVVPGRSLFSHQAVGVPGSVAGLCAAHKQLGRLPLARLVAPAQQVAREGFIVGPTLAMVLAANEKYLGRWPASRDIFFAAGAPLRAGARLVQSDLADALAAIARDGPAAFYEGWIGRRIAADMAAHQGLITEQDLRDYRVVTRAPVVGSYRGHQVLSMPPPSSGGVHLVQMLNMLEGFPLRDYGQNSARTVHLMTEVMKRAYADRAEFLGDPDFVRIPQAGLLSRRYAAQLVAGIDPERATPSSSIRPGNPGDYESDQTTHYSVADSQGNLVSTTYTLNLGFGSGIVAAGTGILLNNEMDDFSVKTGVPNAFGLLGGDANAVGARRRPLSSMTPTIVLKDGRPWLATGSPGGSRIITITLQTLVNMIDFGMNAAQAGLAPRFHHQWMPDELRIERGFSADTLALLAARGHKLVERPAMGRTQTITLERGGLSGWSDTRNAEALALGY